MKSPLVNTVNQWLEYLETDRFPGAFQSEFDRIREHRTLKFSFPRQTGKTTYLLGKLYTTNSIMLMKNSRMFPESRSYVNVHTFGENLVERYIGLDEVYDHILIDEPGFMSRQEEERLIELVLMLSSRRRLSKKFSIIALGTH